jgi:hypothetical protein
MGSKRGAYSVSRDRRTNPSSHFATISEWRSAGKQVFSMSARLGVEQSG